MPGPHVHFRLTMQWAIEAGLDAAEAEVVGRASLLVDQLWPGSRKPARHFNPTASLLMAPLESRRAVALALAGDRAGALTHLGYSLHSRQDAIGHGRLGLNHLALYTGLPFRDPDVWETMPRSVQARIERATRNELRRFVARTSTAPGGHAAR